MVSSLLGQWMLSYWHAALWRLVRVHHREARRADPAATEQQSTLHVWASMRDNPAMLLWLDECGTIAGAVSTLCKVPLQYVAPLFLLNLLIHTIVFGDQIVGWILLPVIVPISAMYMLFAHLALKTVPLPHVPLLHEEKGQVALSHQEVRLPLCTFCCSHPHAAPAHANLSYCIHIMISTLGQLIEAVAMRGYHRTYAAVPF